MDQSKVVLATWPEYQLVTFEFFLWMVRGLRFGPQYVRLPSGRGATVTGARGRITQRTRQLWTQSKVVFATWLESQLVTFEFFLGMVRGLRFGPQYVRFLREGVQR